MDYSTGQSTVIQELDKKGLHYPNQIKRKLEEDMLILGMGIISFVISILIIPSRPFLSLLKLLT